MTDYHKRIDQDIQKILNQDLTFNYCLLNSYSGTLARNLHNAYEKIENDYIKNSTSESHDRCYVCINLQFTRCKIKGVFEVVGRLFAFILTIPLDILKFTFTLSTERCFEYTSANAIAIADSFFKPEYYAKECKKLDRARRHSPKSHGRV